MQIDADIPLVALSDKIQGVVSFFFNPSDDWIESTPHQLSATAIQLFGREIIGPDSGGRLMQIYASRHRSEWIVEVQIEMQMPLVAPSGKAQGGVLFRSPLG